MRALHQSRMQSGFRLETNLIDFLLAVLALSRIPATAVTHCPEPKTQLFRPVLRSRNTGIDLLPPDAVGYSLSPLSDYRQVHDQTPAPAELGRGTRK